MQTRVSIREHRDMSNEISLAHISTAFADAVDRAAAAVIQVQGHRRPGTGLVHSDDVIVTTAGALGGEDNLHVRRPDGSIVDAQLAGWDPATRLAILRVTGLGLAPIVRSSTAPRVGHLALAVARSWSNAVTATAGLVSVIGGPLPTGRQRAIEQVIRTSAPMHDGFSGGAFVDTAGALIGVATAARIRGLGVVIPASIAWKTADTLLEHGSIKRGYIGIAAQPVPLKVEQDGRDTALLVMAVNDGSPAAMAGVIVGDVILSFEGRAVQSPEDLLDLLTGDVVGRAVTLRVLRGGKPTEVSVLVGERPAK
jgi:S1-C subfamily serine protease